MPRYIDADELYETVTKKYSDIVAGCYPYNIVAYDMARLVKEAPTADVVPRGEVEELTRENESLAKTVNEASELIRKLRSKVEKSKTEVAREIFEELETKAPWFCENQTAYEHFNEELAELKKKYTEEKKDEKN